MFTGIIQDIGEIASIDKQGDWTVAIRAGKLPLDRLAIGASIACSGICLTVIKKGVGTFKVQVSGETLSCTTALHWKPGTRLNLEPALRMGDEAGGHLVTGHIDGLAKILEKIPENKSLRVTLEVSHELARFVAPKGSVALDGVSLTVNEVKNTRFGVNLIPFTQNETTLGALEPGAEANFEVDLIARYTARLLEQ
jgi:riboflavin synthase